MLEEIASATSVIGGFYAFVKYLRKKFRKKVPPVDSVASRFVQLFEAHGVHRNQIPRFFDHGLTPAQVKDDDALLQALTEEMLTDAAGLFTIRREWLDGASSQIYEPHHFYKEPERFAQFIDKLLKHADQLGGQLFVEQNPSKRCEIHSLLVLEEGIGFVGDKTIYRYHLCEFHCYNYWKTRAYLTACIAHAWERDFYIHGGQMETKQISPLLEGEAFIEVSELGGGIAHQGRRWDPEYMALDPDVYLEGIDEGQRGQVLALEKWLGLEAKGWMRCGFGDTKRSAFDEKLAQLTSATVES